MEPTTTAPRPANPTTTQRERARLPGAPGSITVDFVLTEDLQDWYATLVKGIGQGVASPACKELITKVQTSLGKDGSRGAYARLYLGLAEGCVGDKVAARKDLDTARSLVPKLVSDPATFVGKDTTCQPEKLLVWAYDTYFDEIITVPCSPT